MNHYEKNTVLITGGSSGIGLEMARQMNQQGHTVIICGRSDEKLSEANKMIPSIIPFQADVTNKSDRQALYEFIRKSHGNLDMLMNNAGIVRRYLLEDTEQLETMIRQEWEVNFIAPVLLADLFLPLLKKNRGTIVNVTSGLVYAPLSIQPSYCATKAALHSMTQSMRLRYGKLGIRVQEIFYPAVDTPFMEGHAPDFAINPTEAVTHALKGLNRQQEEIHVKKAGLLAWISRLMPGKAISIINQDRQQENHIKQTISAAKDDAGD